MKKKKLNFFKNDPFNIKYMIFRKKSKSALFENVKLRTKALVICLKIVIDIGYPKDNDELELLRYMVESYDKNIKDLEQYIANARMYIAYKTKNNGDIINNTGEN